MVKQYAPDLLMWGHKNKLRTEDEKKPSKKNGCKLTEIFGVVFKHKCTRKRMAAGQQRFLLKKKEDLNVDLSK